MTFVYHTEKVKPIVTYLPVFPLGNGETIFKKMTYLCICRMKVKKYGDSDGFEKVKCM